MSATHSASNKQATHKFSVARRVTAARKRSQRTKPFVYPKPFFPQFQSLLNEACRGEEDAFTADHVMALVGELAATRQTLEVLCPGYKVPAVVRKSIERISKKAA
jgi:hypothetical protein